MTGMFTTALVGFFVLSNLSGTTLLGDSAGQNPPEPIYPAYRVALTGYNAVPEQTDDSPFVTASGAYSDPDVVAARSVDLADELPFGSVIAISTGTTTPSCGIGAVQESIGLRVIADSMHPRKRNQIDILFDNDSKVHTGGRDLNPARALGFCKDIEIKVVGHIDIAHIPRTQTELKAALGKSGFATAIGGRS